jgi:PadR family transcriptional regulator, regulatory protein PadR
LVVPPEAFQNLTALAKFGPPGDEPSTQSICPTMANCKRTVDTLPAIFITIADIGGRNLSSNMENVSREILLAFWKVHILHHAGEAPLHGQWMLKELRHHGYEISPGTLYPLLQRMERLGWLKARAKAQGGKRARRDYRLTTKGEKVLALVREQLRELYEEVGDERIK